MKRVVRKRIKTKRYKLDIKSTKSHINMTETEEKISILLLGKIWNNLAAFNMTDITGNC